MTTKGHCVANAVLAYVLTARPEVAVAAMLTSTLPDQLEFFLPLGRHRGATHWLGLWLVVIIAVPLYIRPEVNDYLSRALSPTVQIGATVHLVIGACLYGLALGPFLHVLLDGCSDSGVPVGPFSRRKLKLGMYRTYNSRWRWDLSELLFLGVLIAVCALFWWIQNPAPVVTK